MYFAMKGSGILPYKDARPKLESGCFVASGAQLIGDVSAGEDSSFWFNAVLRADCHYIKIGTRTNIQDCAAVHVSPVTGPVCIGDNVTIGHGAVIHGCTVEDNVVIGMGAIVLDNALIRTNSFVAAGAVVPPGREYPSGVLIMGSPAKVARELTNQELLYIQEAAKHYIEFKSQFSISQAEEI